MAEKDIWEKSSRWSGLSGVVDGLTKILGTAGALIVIFVSAQQFNATQAASQRDSERASNREFMRPFLDRRTSLYFEATAITGAIAGSSDLDHVDKKKVDRFWALYWGDLGMVESAEVEGAMVQYGNLLDYWMNRAAPKDRNDVPRQRRLRS